jgi:chromosome segregation ATPase
VCISLSHENPQETISLRMSIEKTIFSPGERFNVFFTVETTIPHGFRRFQHLPKAFKLALVEEFPRKFKKGDKRFQKTSFIAPSGHVPSEFQLIFEFMFEKEDTSLIKITTVPLSIKILPPEEIPPDQLGIIADHKVDTTGNVTTMLQEFPKLEDEQAFLTEDIEVKETKMKTVDTETITELLPETNLSEKSPEEQIEASDQVITPEDAPTAISLPEDHTDMLTEKISEYTKRLVSLEDQLQRQTRDLKLREEEIVNLKSECTRLDSALGKYREHVNDLERTLDELTPKLKELELKCSDSGKKIQQFEETNAHLHIQLNEKDEEIELQKDELTKLSNYKTQTEHQFIALTAKLKELELRASDQTAKVIALEETRKDLNDQLDKKTEEILQLRKEHESLQVIQRQLKQHAAQLEKTIEEELHTSIAQLQNALKDRETKINQLKRRLNDAEKQLTEKEKIIEQQQKEIEDLKEQVIEGPVSDVIEYFGPPEEQTEESNVQEDLSLTSTEPAAEARMDESEYIPPVEVESETPTLPSEVGGLIEETVVEKTEELAIEEIAAEAIKEKATPMPTAPQCAICGNSSCPKCGSTTLFCKVRCTHCQSVFHRHCAQKLLTPENKYIIRCPNCSEKIVL